MANPEHVKILKQGVDAWNEWRAKNPGGLPDFRGEDLHGAFLLGANLYKADFHSADLREANLSEANLLRANLYKANLSTAILCRANLVQADVSMANLSRADFSEADLTNADLSGSNLIGANFRKASLDLAQLSGAPLDKADFTNAEIGFSVLGDNDLSAVKGLETMKHRGPSTIGIDTIYKSKGNIPEVFLRGAGVPEDFITYMKSLVGRAIEFYSCFISYSTKDSDFAQRLHADLQQKGVRCWFAPEDMKIGDKFRMRIDESIRVYDKLMVILSANSINSPWVEEEVEAALEKERKQNKPALFPIRLDAAVMETEQAWAASLRRTRHIGDFCAWKDHDPYQKSFERLLRDLKA
jgi:hypothetical protein